MLDVPHRLLPYATVASDACYLAGWVIAFVSAGNLTEAWAFPICFVVGSLGGVAALLRSRRTLTWRVTASVILNSGLLGLVVAWWRWADTEPEGRWSIAAYALGCGLLGGPGTDLVEKILLAVIEKKK